MYKKKLPCNLAVAVATAVAAVAAAAAAAFVLRAEIA